MTQSVHPLIYSMLFCYVSLWQKNCPRFGHNVNLASNPGAVPGGLVSPAVGGSGDNDVRPKAFGFQLKSVCTLFTKCSWQM